MLPRRLHRLDVIHESVVTAIEIAAKNVSHSTLLQALESPRMSRSLQPGTVNGLGGEAGKTGCLDLVEGLFK